jgi:hypothetical protein
VAAEAPVPVLEAPPKSTAQQSAQNWLEMMGGHVFDMVGGAATKKTPTSGPSMAVPASRLGNIEAEAEKAAEDLKARKRAGVAPWKFGDGAAELQDSKPWYALASGEAVPDRVHLNPFGKPVDSTVIARRDDAYVRSCA